MDLLTPRGLWMLGLLAPLVVLYILKIRRQRRRIASTWLWAVAQRDLMARSPFKKLIAQIPLVLQAIVLAALALALARPATRGRELVGDHVALIIDTSASMTALSAPGAETTRLDLAKRAAGELLQSLTPGSDAMIIEAAHEARLASALDRDRRRLAAAVERIGAADVEGDLASAVALAVDRLKQLGGSRRIVVITDGYLARTEALSSSLPLEVMTVGDRVDNAAIVRVDVRSGSDPVAKSEQVQAFLVVANFGKGPRDLFVTMRQEGASDVLASRRVLVQPGEKLPVVLTFHPSAGDYRKGVLLDIAPHDAMPVDDTAYARVPAGEKLPVFMASANGKTASPWLERALVSDPMVEVRSGSLATLTAAQGVALDAFVVVEGACPEGVPGGDLLIVDPPPGRCLGTTVGRTLEQPVITSWETADPRMRFLTLDGVHIAKAKSLEPEGPTQQLIRTQDGAIASDVSTPTRAGTMLGFDVGETDWPLKASFVLFVRNLLEQARAHRAHGMSGPGRSGEPLRVSLPASANEVEVEMPDGTKSKAPVRNGLLVLPEVARAGLYHLSWQGPQAGSMVVPANLGSEAESNIGELTAIAKADPAVTVSDAATRAQAHVEWTWLLALVALAFVLADVWYLTRTPRAPALAAAQPRPPERAQS